MGLFSQIKTVCGKEKSGVRQNALSHPHLPPIMADVERQDSTVGFGVRQPGLASSATYQQCDLGKDPYVLGVSIS